MIVFLCVCALSATEFPFKAQTGHIDLYSIVLYVAMNMILGGGVLTTVHRLSPREIILASALAALIISGLLVCIMGALQSCAAAHADMPMLLVALKSGRVMYLISLPVIAASIFTTMLSAFKAVYDYLYGFIGNKPISAGIVLVGGSLVGALGFTSVVGMLYPITGAIGILYILSNGWYLVRTRVKRRVKQKTKRIKSAVKNRL